MNTIQNFFVDLLNGFSLDQIPLFIFQLLAAGLAAHLLQIILNKKVGETVIDYGALTAVAVAFVAAIVKNTEPYAILGAAIILLFLRGSSKSKMETLGLVLVVTLGVGCGVGSVILTGIGALVVYSVILFTPIKK